MVLGVQLHDQRILFRRPDLVLLDRRIDVIVVALTTLLRRSSWHHLCNLGPAARHARTGRRTLSAPDTELGRGTGCHAGTPTILVPYHKCAFSYHSPPGSHGVLQVKRRPHVYTGQRARVCIAAAPYPHPTDCTLPTTGG